MIHSLDANRRMNRARYRRAVGRTVQLCGPGSAGAGGPSVASDPDDCERGGVGFGAGFCRALFADWTAVDCSREAVAGDVVTGVLFDPLGAAVDGAAGVRFVVPLVCRAWDRRSGVGSFGVLEEPRPAAGRRYRGEVLERGAVATAGQETSVERPLLG